MVKSFFLILQYRTQADSDNWVIGKYFQVIGHWLSRRASFQGIVPRKDSVSKAKGLSIVPCMADSHSFSEMDELQRLDVSNEPGNLVKVVPASVYRTICSEEPNCN